MELFEIELSMCMKMDLALDNLKCRKAKARKQVIILISLVFNLVEDFNSRYDQYSVTLAY